MYNLLFHKIHTNNAKLVVVQLYKLLDSIENNNRTENEKNILLEGRKWQFYRNPMNQNEQMLTYYPEYNTVEECIEANNFLKSNFKTVRKNGIRLLANNESKFYNVVNNSRITTDVANEHLAPPRTLFIYGNCNAVGAFVEDKYTIACVLQRELNAKSQSACKVVNNANWGNFDESARQIVAELKISKSDIIILLTHSYDNAKAALALKNFDTHDFLLNLDYTKVFNFKHDYDILFDNVHMASRGYEIVGKKLFNDISSIIEQKHKEKSYSGFEKTNPESVKIFEEIKKKNADFVGSIGSIVMNCNPFTLGHKFLIEKALAVCDYLYIFVVEEDKSFFSTEHRYNMVEQGISDLKRCCVVKSTLLILSTETFPEYFSKEDISDVIKIDMSHDINIFCDVIAPILDIKYRFVGEEPYCNVTRQYNDAMRKILTNKGINFIEISRKSFNGQKISASAVRNLIKENNLSAIKTLVPITTFKYLLDNDFLRSKE
jgi:[citrate (pro-3S)-lyase] ligase